jgi:O-methyltransferase involved in polyketide biosynthesis
VWEAVTLYLTETGVRETFEFLASAQPGSQLVFTYLRKDFLDATTLYGDEAGLPGIRGETPTVALRAHTRTDRRIPGPLRLNLDRAVGEQEFTTQYVNLHQ